MSTCPSTHSPQNAPEGRAVQPASLQLVARKGTPAGALRSRILDAARDGATTRVIARRLAVSEDRVAEVIAEELEYADRLSAHLEVMFLPAVVAALRETLREAREGCAEGRAA